MTDRDQHDSTTPDPVRMTAADLEGLDYETPPEEGGQIVQTAYAYDPCHDVWIVRSHDRSDRSTRYLAVENREEDVDDLCVGANGAPFVGRRVPLIIEDEIDIHRWTDCAHGYVQHYPGADEPCDCAVRVHEGAYTGRYYLSAGDDDERETAGDPDGYETLGDAEDAAIALAGEMDEGDGLSSEQLRARARAEAAARATARGEWGVVWVDPDGGAPYCTRRYDDEGDAQREVDGWYEDTRAANPGTTLLWRLMVCPEVRHVGDGAEPIL